MLGNDFEERDKVVVPDVDFRMPHAVEMPSFLSDDTGQMISQHCAPLDQPSHVRRSHEKSNVNARTSTPIPIKSSLEDASNELVDGWNSEKPEVNSDLLHDPSSKSLTNGRSSAGSWEHKSSRNGSVVSVNGAGNGVSENGVRSAAPQNGVARVWTGGLSSVASTNGNFQSTATTDFYPEAPTTNGDSEPSTDFEIPPPVPTSSQSTGPVTYTSSLIPATPQLNQSPARVATASPHRFSSPPAYPSPSAPFAPSPVSNSVSQSGSATLKHRHTLQVPKVGTGRSSRDGDDAVYSSGRFSPTILTAGVRRGSLSLNRRNTQSLHSNLPYEEVPQDEDAMRWAEAIRQKRASKRKRKDEEEDDRVVVGTKVDQHHVNWVTAYNMLTGIRFTVSRTNAKLDRPLTDADFEAKHKFSFDM